MKKESKEELDNILLHCDRDNLTFKLRLVYHFKF